MIHFMASFHSKLQQNKRCKITHQPSLSLTPWTSQTQQHLYSSKLLRALRPNNPISARQVRAAAYRVLAATVKRPARWSRAILADPFRRSKHRHHKKVNKCSANRLIKKSKPDICRKLPAIQTKARLLRRLIPGCRNVSFPTLLEEAGDYISALEMQVRAMTAVADLLAAGAPPPAPIGFT